MRKIFLFLIICIILLTSCKNSPRDSDVTSSSTPNESTSLPSTTQPKETTSTPSTTIPSSSNQEQTGTGNISIEDGYTDTIPWGPLQ